MLHDLIQGLDRNRFTPCSIVFQAGPEAEALACSGAPATVAPAPEFLLELMRGAAPVPDLVWRYARSWPEVRRFEKSLAQAIQASGAAAVITAGTLAHVHGGGAARRAQRPALWLAHEWHKNPRIRLFMAFHARRTATALACCSGFVAGQFSGHQAPMVIHGGASPEACAPKTGHEIIREKLGIPIDAPVAGMCAPALPGRGHGLFLRAAARIREDVRTARFIIAGAHQTHGLAQTLGERAQAYALTECLSMPGPQLDEADLIDIMDVFVHPAQSPEPFGRDIVRAMMRGKPVAASASGGPDEIVRNAETGILVEPGDSVRLARAVVQLLDNPEVMLAFGENGRKRAMELFTLERATSAFQSLMERIIP
jgi:glycosyltransferase involved in cell wall biosynthesis